MPEAVGVTEFKVGVFEFDCWADALSPPYRMAPHPNAPMASTSMSKTPAGLDRAAPRE